MMKTNIVMIVFAFPDSVFKKLNLFRYPCYNIYLGFTAGIYTFSKSFHMPLLQYIPWICCGHSHFPFFTKFLFLVAEFLDLKTSFVRLSSLPYSYPFPSCFLFHSASLFSDIVSVSFSCSVCESLILSHSGCLSVCLSVCSSDCLSVHPSVHPSVYLPARFSVCPFVCVCT